jgi:hypothetical protein
LKNEDYTEADMEKLRFILFTARRKQYLDDMDKLILGDQHGDSVQMFTTSFSYHVFSVVPREITKIHNKSSLPDKFDHLLGLTKAIKGNDVWMHDYEDGETLKRMLSALGRLWKSVLTHSNEDLEIDAEFTRPGVEAMLKDFTKEVKSGPESPAFRWK